MPRIFEDFFSTKEDCCGLGLSIVKEIVERHRGRVEVLSEPNKGSTFTILLPRKPATDATSEVRNVGHVVARS